MISRGFDELGYPIFKGNRLSVEESQEFSELLWSLDTPCHVRLEEGHNYLTDVITSTSNTSVYGWPEKQHIFAGHIVDNATLDEHALRDGFDKEDLLGPYIVDLTTNPDGELQVMASICSEDVHDADSVPQYDEGVCRYWGAWPDSPIPNHRLFVVFNREPKSEEEAFDAAKAYCGE